MYGMVNKALEDMLRERWGVDAWHRVREKAGVTTEVFIGNEAYPDDVTYALVGAAHEHLAVPREEILHRLGEHWVLRTAREKYGALLESAGRTLPEFLENLPSLHARITLILPALEPPVFRVSDRRPDGLTLHYSSRRAGLRPFVLGLLSGLGTMFGVALSVADEAEPGGDRFVLRWGAGSR